ncbi:hypothetical protein BY996DRAFT_6411717 [Phakopsora pachyrhizi]|nr:hypothetical protein BY996DRAFT_6411717 [Phakopsora pachyrhizi]
MTLDGKAIVACPLRLLAAPLGTCLASIDSVLKNIELHGSSLLWANLLWPNLENLVWLSLVQPTLALVDFHAFVLSAQTGLVLAKAWPLNLLNQSGVCNSQLIWPYNESIRESQTDNSQYDSFKLIYEGELITPPVNRTTG